MCGQDGDAFAKNIAECAADLLRVPGDNDGHDFYAVHLAAKSDGKAAAAAGDDAAENCAQQQVLLCKW